MGGGRQRSLRLGLAPALRWGLATGGDGLEIVALPTTWARTFALSLDLQARGEKRKNNNTIFVFGFPVLRSRLCGLLYLVCRACEDLGVVRFPGWLTGSAGAVVPTSCPEKLIFVPKICVPKICVLMCAVFVAAWEGLRV